MMDAIKFNKACSDQHNKPAYGTSQRSQPRSGDLFIAYGTSQGSQPRSGDLFIAYGTSHRFQPRSGDLIIAYGTSQGSQPRSGGLFIELAYLLFILLQAVIVPDRSYGALIFDDGRYL